MKRSRKIWVFVIGGIVVLGFVSYLTTEVHWDGGFLTAKFQMRFRNSLNEPVKGVMLLVEGKDGKPLYDFPVDDFTEGSVPTSNEEGELVFHHVSNGLEFGGKRAYIFWLIPVGACSGPEVNCRFLLNGSEVYRVPFAELYESSLNNGEGVERSNSLPMSKSRIRLSKWKWAKSGQGKALRDVDKDDMSQLEEGEMEFPLIQKSVTLK